VSFYIEKKVQYGRSVLILPSAGLGHEMQHDALGVNHFLPAEVLVVPDVLGRSQGCHGADCEGVADLGEGEGILTDRLVGVGGCFPATPCREIIQLDVLQVAKFGEGIGCWSGVNPLLDGAIRVVRV
jgi:hypothetical protein